MEREDRRRIKEKGREKIRQRWMVKKEEKVRKRKKGRWEREKGRLLECCVWHGKDLIDLPSPEKMT